MSVKRASFSSLNIDIQSWVERLGWSSLRDIQEAAIEPILSGDRDVIISASTSAGKTEAVFLPSCSKYLDLSLGGVGILYIAPLKALINDQYKRLKSLSEIGIQLIPWHGDTSWGLKSSWLRKPSGILLITPESLESFLLNRNSWLSYAFSNLLYVVIDEFHTFMGTERGCQLSSLLNRLEFMLNRKVPRIALSATFSDLDTTRYHLRDNGDFPFSLISSDKHYSALDIKLKGYLSYSFDNFTWVSKFTNSYVKKKPINRTLQDDLYSMLRGKFNIVFTNSRRDVEEITIALKERCLRDGSDNEFFPHHGSLSKELRLLPEFRLKEGKLPTTVVSTFTLELGIDIGKVDSVVQVGVSSVVSSLRQRVGRSGRRGNKAILRLLIRESKLSGRGDGSFINSLRLRTIQSVAIINLLLRKSYAPSPSGQYHFSTLFQQTLSVVGQYGSFAFDDLWDLLCVKGPFKLVDKSLYLSFIELLISKDFLLRDVLFSLSLGVKGRELTKHYSFYTAFKTSLKYTLESDACTLGSIAYNKNLSKGDSILFGGDYWEILKVDEESRVISLKKSLEGKVPKFVGEGPVVDDMVREEIFRIYETRDYPDYLDDVSSSFFREGLDSFYSLSLDKFSIIERGEGLYLFPWLGDRVIHTIVFLLRSKDLDIYHIGFGIVAINDITLLSFKELIASMLSGSKPSSKELSNLVQSTTIDKYDSFLTREFLDLSYGHKFFDIDKAWDYLSSLVL